MSTIRADNLTSSNGVGGSIPIRFAIQGTAKAWFNLNGTGTIAERDSFNISSYVDNGVGDYTANFSTAMPNANYTMTTSHQVVAAAATSSMIFTNGSSASVPPTTTAARAVWFTPGVGYSDNPYAVGTFNGDPA